MEYFDFTKWCEKILSKDDNELTEIERLENQINKDCYPNWCQKVNGKIPENIAETLIEEFDDSNYVLFVHKTGKVSNKEVFEKGLKILSGNNIEKTATVYGGKSLGNKISFFEDIATAHEYKKSTKAMILKIPVTSFLDYEPGKSKPILMDTEELAEDAGVIIQGETQKILLPEYILGSVELDGDKVYSFDKNPNYKEIHNHSNDGLVCANGLIDNYILDHGEYGTERITFETF